MDRKIFIGSLGTFALSLIAYIYVVCIGGGGFFELCFYALAFVFCTFLCGRLIGQYITPHIVGEDSFPLSFVYGTSFTFLSFIVCSLAGVKELCLVVPFVVGGFYLYNSRDTIFKQKLTIKPYHSVLLLTGTVFLFLYTLCVLLPSARGDKLGNFFIHQDMLWSVGNAASVYNGFPLVDMRFSASTLNYHYLNDALAGILGMGTFNPAYESLCFYFYPLMGLSLIISLFILAKKVCKNDFLASLFPLMVLWANGVGSESTYHYLSNINGQGGATLILCAGFLLLANPPKNKRSYMGYFVSALITGFTISMFKSTIGALFILSVAAASIVGFFTKKSSFCHLIALGGLSLGFVSAYIFIFSHAINNLVFNGLSALVDLPKALWSSAPLVVLLYSAALIFSLFNFKRLSFLQLTAHAMAFGGAIAFSVYYHYSASQIYFLLIAIPMMWLACLEFVDSAFFTPKKLGAIFTALLVVCCIPAGVRMIPNARTGVQALLRIYNLRQFDYDESYITKDDYDAMVWLRTNTDQSAIFATNRNNKVFAAAEGTFHYYSAVSQRRAYLESYRYCMDYSGMYTEVRRRLEEVSDKIFQEYDEATAFKVAREEKIDYLLVFAPLEQTSWEAVPVYENATLKIYKV